MRRRPVVWSPAARADLHRIIAYLIERSPSAATRTLGGLESVARSLESFSERGRVVPEMAEAGFSDFRELIRPPHRLVYEVRGDRVEVLGVFDARRDLEQVLFDRLMDS